VSQFDSGEILLVEDNPADAELTLHALAKHKLANKLHHAKDGEEALDFHFCRGPYAQRTFDMAPQIILLDLKLPKVDGLQVLAQIKKDERTRAIPVIMLTSSSEERDLIASYQLGVNSYIQKPVNFGDFSDVVRQLGMYWLLVNRLPPVAVFRQA
jgi:two-component system response regulator